jgi:type IV secretory pathway TraG/TraD family ATPase VirD4
MPPQFATLLSPLITVVVNIVIKELLSLEDNLQRRRFVICDEIAKLGKLDSLIDGLTLGRSKGLSMWIGTQDFGKMDTIYGRAVRETLWNNTVAKIILRTDAPDTADYISRALGEAEVEEGRKSYSMGVADYRDGLSFSRQEKVKRVLLPAEIQAIKDLTAVIKLGHFAPAYPCKIVRKNLIRREPAFSEARQPQVQQVQEQEQTQERTQEQMDMSFM